MKHISHDLILMLFGLLNIIESSERGYPLPSFRTLFKH